MGFLLPLLGVLRDSSWFSLELDIFRVYDWSAMYRLSWSLFFIMFQYLDRSCTNTPVASFAEFMVYFCLRIGSRFCLMIFSLLLPY